MLRSFSIRFVWMLLLLLGLWSVAAHAEKFQYRYKSLNNLVSDESTFYPVAIDDKGRVYGSVYNRTDNTDSNIAVYLDGELTILQSGDARVANNRGTVGGGIYYDRPSFATQAALFHGDQVELVPFQPGDTSSYVAALNDRGTAVVWTIDSNYTSRYSLYHRGRTYPLDLEPGAFVDSINNQGIIAGNVFAADSYGFSYDPFKDDSTLLKPILSDTSSFVQGINTRGDVLGYSYITDAIERIGVWNRKGKFKPYFIEGIHKFPTLSNRLRFNDNNLIVVSSVYSPVREIGISYLIPKPGVRLNLARLVNNMPKGGQLSWIQEINKQGSMIGYNNANYENFLLERIKSRH